MSPPPNRKSRPRNPNGCTAWATKTPTTRSIGDLASTWLEGLADTLAETPAEPDEASADVGADSGDVPNWLQDYEAPEVVAEMPPDDEPEPASEPPQPETPPSPPAEEDTGRLKLLEELGLQEIETSEETIAVPSDRDAGESYDLGELEGMDDDQIFDWLEGLAARDAEEGQEEVPGASGTKPPKSAEATDEGSGAPDESADADLGWLAQLAEQRGINSDVQTAPAAASCSPGAGR